MTGFEKRQNRAVEVADWLTINNKEVPIKVKELPQTKLRFYAENPRIYSLVRRDKNHEVTQSEIELQLLEMEHVKALKEDIKRNGGLIEPVIVRDGTFEVLEGNSRLAAYRALAKIDPITWGHIKCWILPSDISDSQVFALLGQYHIKGRKDWAPYEQAGFLYRRHKKHNTDIETLCKEIGESRKKVKHLIETYQFMIDHEENDVRRWSYYDEYLKSSRIKRARKKFPGLDETIVEMIGSGEIPKAVELREQLPLVCDGPGRNLKRFMEKKVTLAKAFQVADRAGDENDDLKRLTKFRKWIVKHDVKVSLVKSNGRLRKQIRFEIGKLLIRMEALSKKLGG
jgi:ParB-like nuclease domain